MLKYWEILFELPFPFLDTRYLNSIQYKVSGMVLLGYDNGFEPCLCIFMYIHGVMGLCIRIISLF